jgi:hypothetical protein
MQDASFREHAFPDVGRLWTMLISGAPTPHRPRDTHLVTRSKRNSRAPSLRTVRKRSSGSFVTWDLHRKAVPYSYTTPHTYLPPLQVVMAPRS